MLKSINVRKKQLNLRKSLYLLAVLSVITLSIFFRTYELVRVPLGFFTDEAAIGYNAYKILSTAKDEYGEFLPIFFHSYGDYRLPIPIYANVISTALLGPTDFAVRFTSATWGVLGVIFMFLLLKEMFDKHIALLGMLMLALLPWHVHLSRWGSEYIYFPTFFTISLWLLVRFIKHKKFIFLILTAGFFGIGMYTYYPSLFITPLFLLFTLFVCLHLLIGSVGVKRALIQVIVAGIIFLALCIPFLLAFYDGTITTRWKSVENHHLTKDEKVNIFFETYIQHLSPEYLFLKGDIGIRGHYITRHSPKGVGQAYAAMSIFFYIGIVGLFFINKRYFLLMFLLLLLYPLSTAITYDVYATRSVVGIIPIVIFSSAGLFFVFGLFRKIKKPHISKIIKLSLLVVFLTILSYESVRFARIYFHQFPKESYNWDGFQYGYKQAMELFINKYYDEYDKLRISHRFNQSEGLQSFYKLTLLCGKCAYLENPIKIYDNEKALYVAREDDIKEAKELYPDYNFVQIDAIKPEGVKETELFVGYFERITR